MREKNDYESDPIRTAVRRAQQERQHGANAACKACGETDVRVLVKNSRPKLCEACYRKKHGKPPIDMHHPAGRANADYTVPIPANVHRQLSDAQYDWASGVLQNPEKCPLLAGAACLRGTVETVNGLLDWLMSIIEPILLMLSAWMEEQHGAQWWKKSPLTYLSPMEKVYV